MNFFESIRQDLAAKYDAELAIVEQRYAMGLSQLQTTILEVLKNKKGEALFANDLDKKLQEGYLIGYNQALDQAKHIVTEGFKNI